MYEDVWWLSDTNQLDTIACFFGGEILNFIAGLGLRNTALELDFGHEG